MARAARRGGTAQRTAERPEQRGPAEVRVPSGSWLVCGGDGRLTAYAYGPEGVLRWTEERPGGQDWQGPDLFPATGIDHLTLAQDTHRYVHLAGRRRTGREPGTGPVVEFVHAVQYQTGRTLGTFRSLGNPHIKIVSRQPRVGTPVLAVDNGGTVHLVMCNGARGMTIRREDKTGKWTGWKDLKGRLLYERPAAVATSTGTLELLAAGEEPAWHFRREVPHGPFERLPDIPLSVRPGSLTGIETSPGRVTYYWTDPDSGAVVAHRPGGWLIPLGGAPGEGPVTVLRTPVDGVDSTVFAYRDEAGEVFLAHCRSEHEQDGLWWAPTGLHGIGGPGLAVDGAGRLVVGVYGPDGRLRLARHDGRRGLALGPVLTV
ncbi:hypothetical protein ACQYWQ_24950 [Streptomyces sp. P6-2-1]|uniref:hypothetical protein n=1 Tax=Streptomyces sp. P6-2-1 TaxID=3422591 RepID=UPI003D35D842